MDGCAQGPGWGGLLGERMAHGRGGARAAGRGPRGLLGALWAVGSPTPSRARAIGGHELSTEASSSQLLNDTSPGPAIDLEGTFCFV